LGGLKSLDHIGSCVSFFLFSVTMSYKKKTRLALDYSIVLIYEPVNYDYRVRVSMDKFIYILRFFSNKLTKLRFLYG